MINREETNHSGQNNQQINVILETALHKKGIEVPVLRKTTQRVMDSIEDPDSNAFELSEIIQSDPTLGGHVIRVANSVAYSPNSNVVSLQQAITRLGVIEIANIVFSITLNSKLFNAPGYEQYMSAIWKHSLASALWGKEIARAMRSNVEAAFLCCLVHTIGRPAILQTVAASAEKVLSEPEINKLFETYESAFSETVAADWGLPNIIRESVVYYKNFQDAPTEPKLAATVAFSHLLADYTLSPDEYETQDILNSSALDTLNLYPDEVSSILEKQETIVENMNSLLEK